MITLEIIKYDTSRWQLKYINVSYVLKYLYVYLLKYILPYIGVTMSLS